MSNNADFYFEEARGGVLDIIMILLAESADFGYFNVFMLDKSLRLIHLPSQSGGDFWFVQSFICFRVDHRSWRLLHLPLLDRMDSLVFY